MGESASTNPVFSVQDETGTVYQLTISAVQPSPAASLAVVGDTGMFSGVPDAGTDGFAPPSAVVVPFTVTQVTDQFTFSISTANENTASWPRSGTIEWLTGSNTNAQWTVGGIDPANAYITSDYLTKYAASRGTTLPTSTITAAQAIIKASDYLDQRYSYRGIKLVQNVGVDTSDANAVFLEPWLTPFSTNATLTNMTPSTTPQHTEWPRQGVVDNNGDTINGIPNILKMACAELAIRVLSGIVLQPDYDPSIITPGGVVQSISNEVGPIKVSKTYDTKLGIGYIADFPQVTRMLQRAGLLVANRGRTIMR